MASVIETVLLGSTTDDARFRYNGRYGPIRETGGKVHTVLYYWNPGTLSFDLATAPAGGGGGGDATAANQVTQIAAEQSIETAVASHRMKVLGAGDLVKTFTWLDFGTSNVRPSTIVHSSASVGGASHTATFAWTLVGSQYRLDTITWS